VNNNYNHQSQSPHKPLWRRCLNRLLHKLARSLPGALTLRPWLHRMRGVKIGSDVFIGEDVYLENEYPELIEIGDGCALGPEIMILAHVGRSDLKQGGITGKVIIGKDVWIGARVFIAASPGAPLKIGDGAVIGACSVIVNRSVPTQAFLRVENTRQAGIATVPFAGKNSYRDFLTGLTGMQR
jgi:acetyltransferase-like isoleucine patch superfamily enzyme